VCTPRLDEDSVEFVELSLCSCHRAESLLGQFLGLLILAVPQQLHDTALVRGEAADFTDDALDERRILSLKALAMGWLWFPL